MAGGGGDGSRAGGSSDVGSFTFFTSTVLANEYYLAAACIGTVRSKCDHRGDLELLFFAHFAGGLTYKLVTVRGFKQLRHGILVGYSTQLRTTAYSICTMYDDVYAGFQHCAQLSIEYRTPLHAKSVGQSGRPET